MDRTSTQLRCLRVRKHFTQEALEAASGVSQSVLSKLESKGPGAALAQAFAIADALGVSVDELFGEDARRRWASTRVRARPRELKDTTTPRRSRAA